MNFKGFINNPPPDGGGNRLPLPPNLSLTRQQSVYSLTFDELQTTMGGLGKDFGSMNMDELLRNIWGAEDIQTMTNIVGGRGSGHQEGTSGLQRQGSLTLPRTLSQKTVDEVWKDISKDESGTGRSNMPQRQQTLGEMTLEEFLVRAGVVREDNQPPQPLPGKENFGGFFSQLCRPGDNMGYGGLNFQQNGAGAGAGIQPSNLPLNVNGVRSNHQIQHPLVHQQQQQQTIFTKQSALGYGTQLGSPGIRGDPHRGGMTNGMMQASALRGGGIGMVGLGGSPASQISSDGIGKSSGDASSVSPVPYAFNGGLRGRRSGALEKVVERRQRRMIKNRESAARSRARKQAYTMELEAEVAKLKEENQKLKKRQMEIMEMKKNQDVEMTNPQHGGKKRCLRRTQTGPL